MVQNLLVCLLWLSAFGGERRRLASHVRSIWAFQRLDTLEVACRAPKMESAGADV
jgi:hypothetical protein